VSDSAVAVDDVDAEDSREDAWEQMRDGYLYIQQHYEKIFSGESVDELDGERKEELRDQAIFGPPEQVVDELEIYRETLGDDVHFIVRTYYTGIGTDRMAECIQRLGEDVKPHLT